MNLSQDFYFVGGWGLRLASLGVGMMLIVYSGYSRLKSQQVVITGAVIAFLIYMLVLAVLTWARGHYIWYSAMGAVGFVMVLGLFLAGMTFAAGCKSGRFDVSMGAVRVVLLAAIFAQFRFLGHIKEISFHGVSRGFGEDDLNPVSVAFNHSTLALICVVTALFARRVYDKALLLSVASLALFIAMSSASRGALLSFAVTLCYLIFLCRHKIFSKRGLVLFPFVAAIGVSGFTMLYRVNFGFAGKVDLLVKRFQKVALYASGESSDMSSAGRLEGVQAYYEILDKWVIFGLEGYKGYPHNQFLEIFVRFGLIGVVLFLFSIWAFLYLVKLALTVKSQRSWEFVLITSLFLFGYLQSMTSLSLEMNRVLWLGFGYLVGCYLRRRPVQDVRLLNEPRAAS